MRRIWMRCGLFADATIHLFSFSPLVNATTVICGKLHIKPMHRLCGIAINPVGDRVPDATVKVLSGEKEILSLKSDLNGKFSYDGLQEGSYVVLIQADGYVSQQFPIEIRKPSKRCKRMLEIRLMLAYPYSCTNVRQVKQSRYP